jgi:DNA polymerase sigma
MVKKVENTVKSLWKDASVKIYGSFATNLSIPSSDLDLVVIGTQKTMEEQLIQLSNGL